MKILAKWVEFTVGDWQGPGMLGDLQMPVSFSLLVNFLTEIFSHHLNRLRIYMSVLGGEAGSLTLDLHLIQKLSSSALLTFWARQFFVVVAALSTVEHLAESTHQMPVANSCQVVTTTGIAKYPLTCPTVWELLSSNSLGSKLLSLQSGGRALAQHHDWREGILFKLIPLSAPPSEVSSATNI